MGGPKEHATGLISPARLLVLGLAAMAGFSAHTFAAQSEIGRPDPSFNSSGRASTDFGGLDRAQAVAVQSDGGIVLAGSTQDADFDSQWALARYGPDGTPGGVIQSNFPGGSSENPDNEAAYAITLYDEDIIVAGTALGSPPDEDAADFALARYSGSGLHERFKVTADLGNGLIGDRGRAVAVNAAGQIVVAGSGGEPPPGQPADFDPCLALFEGDGTFLGGGCPDVGYQGGAEAIAIQNDGKVLIAGGTLDNGGARLLVARYIWDQELGPILDPDFGAGNGYVKSSKGWRAFAIAVHDGKIIVAGLGKEEDEDLVLRRYDDKGELDPSFGLDSAGTITLDLPGFKPSAATTGMGMHVEPDGKIILSSGVCPRQNEQGDCPEGGAPIVRVKADGKGLDPGFGQDGVAFAGFPEKAALVALASDPKGKVVAAGWIEGSPVPEAGKSVVAELGNPFPSQDFEDFAVARLLLEPRALVAGLEPKRGPVTGGGRITIRGSRLAGATSVLFGQSRVTTRPCAAGGSTPCFSVVSDGEIVAQAPPGSTTGPVHVVVEAPEGRSLETNNDLYNYLPVVREVAPREGPKAGRTLVTVSGSGLENTRRVVFGDKAIATSCLLPNVSLGTDCFTIQSPQQVSVFSPSSDKAGKVHVRVDVGTGVSEETEADVFTYLDDEILPASAPPSSEESTGSEDSGGPSGPSAPGTSEQPTGARPPTSGLGAPSTSLPGQALGQAGPGSTAPAAAGQAGPAATGSAGPAATDLGPAPAPGALRGPAPPAPAGAPGVLQAPAYTGPFVPVPAPGGAGVPLPAFSDDPATAPRHPMSRMPALPLSAMVLAGCFGVAAAARLPHRRPVRAAPAQAR